jgi:hypothetical protein
MGLGPLSIGERTNVSARKTALIAIVLLGVLTLAILVVLRPGPHGQVEDLFERVAYHLEDGATGDLVEEVDQGYDFVRHFPILDRVQDMDLGLGEDAGERDPEVALRENLRRSANQWYGPQKLRGSRPVVTWRIHEVGEPAADGTFSARVSFSVTGLKPVPTLTNHRFVFSTHGWLRPVARIRDHDPISL